MLTARQNLEDQLEQVQMEILEAGQNICELQVREKYLLQRIEAMNDTLAQSAKAVRLSKDVDLDKLAGDF